MLVLPIVEHLIVVICLIVVNCLVLVYCLPPFANNIENEYLRLLYFLLIVLEENISNTLTSF